MIITIAKINRQLREGVSKKTGKDYSFTSLGIAPEEDTLTDINGDEFGRDDRWLNGIEVEGTTEGWDEGDRVKILVIQKTVVGRDGNDKEVINFKLPDGVEAMVEKAVKPEPEAVPSEDTDPDDF